MPVLEHEVHAKVRQSAAARYGCHNRTRTKAGYFAPDRIYRFDGSYGDRQAFIPDLMSRECRYDHSLTDSKCEGCKNRGSGEAYDQQVREMGK